MEAGEIAHVARDQCQIPHTCSRRQQRVNDGNASSSSQTAPFLGHVTVDVEQAVIIKLRESAQPPIQ